MIYAIYKSPKKAEMYLYLAKRDDFSPVPAELLAMFGKPELVMLLNFDHNKPLARADKDEVKRKIAETGFYLQMPPPVENLHKTFVESQPKPKQAD